MDKELLLLPVSYTLCCCQKEFISSSSGIFLQMQKGHFNISTVAKPWQWKVF